MASWHLKATWALRNSAAIQDGLPLEISVFKASLHYSCCLCIRTVWKGLERAISNRTACEALLYHDGHLFLVSQLVQLVHTSSTGFHLYSPMQIFAAVQNIFIWWPSSSWGERSSFMIIGPWMISLRHFKAYWNASEKWSPTWWVKT